MIDLNCLRAGLKAGDASEEATLSTALPPAAFLAPAPGPVAAPLLAARLGLGEGEASPSSLSGCFSFSFLLPLVGGLFGSSAAFLRDLGLVSDVEEEEEEAEGVSRRGTFFLERVGGMASVRVVSF
jgi:hypothetical protein